MLVKILVAMHKASQVPTEEPYLPVQVGRALSAEIDGVVGDHTGENISDKNPHYCELTAVYWAWKNLSADYVGLCHYRRYFAQYGLKNKKKRILKQQQIEKILQQYDVIVPKKRHYWIETNYSQYIHAHHAQDLDETRVILQEKYPAYLPAFDGCMKQTSGHRFNMFVMKKPLFDAYCAWLFDVLFTLEQRLDITQYSAYDARVFGFVSERLLDVWLKTNRIQYKEMPVVYTEKQNWIKKIWRFLKRKITAGK